MQTCENTADVVKNLASSYNEDFYSIILFFDGCKAACESVVQQFYYCKVMLFKQNTKY